MHDLVEGLNDEQIRRPINAGKWSIFEDIVHLATYQHTFINRIEKIMNEENPSISRYTAETDPLFYDNCTRPTREIIVDLINTRKLLTAKLLSLNRTQLERCGKHPAYGQMNILQWTEFFLLHEAHHLLTIFKQAAELRKVLVQ